MTLHAIADRRRMHRLSINMFLVVVAGKTKCLGRGGRQLDPGHVLVDSNFVTGRAAHLDRGVDVRSLGLVLVTLNAGAGIGFRIERNRMFCRPTQGAEHHNR